MGYFCGVYLNLYFCKGSYQQNLCHISDPNCLPCPERLPSCVGLTDGYHGLRDQWSSDYFNCYKNRTIDVLTCKGFFDPNTKQCVEKILPGTITLSTCNSSDIKICFSVAFIVSLSLFIFRTHWWILQVPSNSSSSKLVKLCWVLWLFHQGLHIQALSPRVSLSSAFLIGKLAVWRFCTSFLCSKTRTYGTLYDHVFLWKYITCIN